MSNIALPMSNEHNAPKFNLNNKGHLPIFFDQYKGPLMLAKAVTYMLNDDSDPETQEAVKQLVNKMETHRTNKECTSCNKSSASPSTSLPNPDPEPSKPIHPSPPGPIKPPKPVIGKFPQNYVPLQEQTIAASPKDDS
ncbi:hypothetical protein GYMLUDRAFT_245682 [Collybiopsis luxurians FD-317 M1]|uniref:Uncharacterized protein n=1 Tax=Collybiopsis luxurians FD-317 M1 TaxID=944289 RepID=A0A0D0C8V2_9AGAR|nr:hypothetical protein GYMLUDRAFT_245682 [Collybiopsis luxurians FD-317 M1]